MTYGVDAVGVALIDDAIVEVKSFGIGLAGAVWENARPRDREAEAFAAEAFQCLKVLLVEMIEIVGDVAGVAVMRFAGRVREGVPDRRLAAIFSDGAFDLVGGGGAAPEEAGGEFEFGGLALRKGEFGKGSGCECGGGGCGRGLGETATSELGHEGIL